MSNPKRAKSAQTRYSNLECRRRRRDCLFICKRIAPRVTASSGRGGHLLRLSLLCRTGVYKVLDIRPSEAVVSIEVLFRSPCCTGLDW